MLVSVNAGDVMVECAHPRRESVARIVSGRCLMPSLPPGELALLVSELSVVGDGIGRSMLKHTEKYEPPSFSPQEKVARSAG
jgi:hypothetical protein